ncbi:hypothetical protein ACQ3I4_03750 [Zafaria sp. Z1313]|uniref:hypothetical protein n=1 Tax=unclassified Zafaria TaxID=2828765 RepID=UPI002E7A8E62|nr:hypothetical protein [Zafaria sp. J156]MEE1620851.1 hypothetical protein [Zafaria sp. J156]
MPEHDSDGTRMTQHASTQGGPDMLRASGETPQPWLGMLRRCSLVGAALTVLVAVVAAIAAGPAAVPSVLAGAALVVVFFGITLVIGHVVGRRNPSAALSAFVVGYVVKVVGFGALVFGLGVPSWIDGTWFLVSAVAMVVVWQATEMVVFSRQRFQLYADPEPETSPGGSRGAA